MFAAGGAVAAGAAFGLLPGTESASYARSEEVKKAGARGEADKKNSLANRSKEESCKSDLSLSGRKQEQNDKANDPSYKAREASKKKAVRQSEEDVKAVRRSVGLESLDGDWRVPVTIDGPSGVFIDGDVDIHSFSFGSDATGACMGTMKVLVGGESGKAQEQASKSTELVRSGESVLVSFNDEPAFEAKISKADAGFTEFDAKGVPSGGAFTYTFWI
jgi:hypothetical protein